MPVLVLVKEENMTIKCETLRAKDGHPVPVLRREASDIWAACTRDGMPPLCGERNGCLTGRKI